MLTLLGQKAMLSPSIWVEKYRPQTITDVIFENDIQFGQFKSFVETGNMPNILISGGPGTGKTTVSRALVNDLKLDPTDVLTINCSDEKIDALREKARGFALTFPVGAFRVVRLEEIDYLSLDGQALLRGLIEVTSGSCRFIATCNYLNKVIPPLRSRFQEFVFKAPDETKVALRMAEILEAEGIEYRPEDLADYVTAGYPDIRKITQLLQQNCAGGELLPVAAAVARGENDWKLGLLECLQRGDWGRARRLVCESAPREEHEDIFRFLYDNVERLFPTATVADEAIVIIADHLRDHSLVADTEINIAACFIRLSQLNQMTGQAN